MKKGFIQLVLPIVIGLLLLGGIFYRVGLTEESKTPILGLSTFQVFQGGTGATTLTGCLTGNGTSAITGTGSACGSGSSAFEIATTSDITQSGYAYFTKTSGRTTLGSVSTSTIANFILPFTSYGASTSTTLGLLGGYFSTASSTQSGNFFLPSLTQGSLYTGTNGKVNTVATSTLTGTGVISVTAGAYTLGATPIVVSCATCGTGTVTSVTGSYPIVSSGGTTPNITFSGLSTTSPWTIGQVAYVGSNNTVTSVATSSIASGVGITVTNGTTAYVLGSQPSVACNTSDASTFGCLTAAKFSQFNSATTTFSSPLVYTLGTNAVTCPTCTAGLSAYDAWTHFNGANSATTTSLAIGTTTANNNQLTVSSTTAPQLSLSASTGIAQWVFRNAGGNLYISTTTVLGTATTSISAVSINGTNGQINIPTGSAGTPALVLGTATIGPGLFYNNGDLGISVLGSEIGEFYGQGFNFLTSGSVSQNVIGFANDVTTGLYSPGASMIGFTTAGAEAFRVDTKQRLGIGTTTPQWKLQVASTTQPQLALSGNSNDNIWTMRSIGGALYLATSSPLTFATSSATSFTITPNGTTTIQSLTILGGASGTSTSAVGFSITSGCFAIGTTCLTQNAGTVTSVLLGAGFQNQGLNLTTTGTLVGALATSATPVISPAGIPYWTGVGSASVPATLGTTATSTLSGTAPIAVSNSPFIIGASGAVITCTNASAGVTGCLTGADYNTFTAKLSSYDAFTHSSIFPQNSATTSIIGIGTTTPYYSLTVASSTGPQFALSDGISGDVQWIQRNAGGNFYLSTTSVAGTSTTTKPALSITNAGVYTISTSTAGCVQTTTNGDFYVATCSTGGGANPAGTGTEVQYRLNGTTFGAIANSAFITQTGGNGWLGLGTTTPRWTLDIASSTEPQLALTDGVNNSHWFFRNAGGNLYIGTTSPVTFATTTIPAITWTNLGFEGLGTSTPWGGLSLNSNALGSGVPEFVIGSSSATHFLIDGAGNVAINDLTPDFKLESTGSFSNGFFGLTRTTDGDIMSVLSTGNIGLGTSTAVYPLTISSSTISQLALSASTGINQWTMRNAGGDLYLSTTTVVGNSTTSIPALTIKTITGNVGIGTSTPYGQLSIDPTNSVNSPSFSIGSNSQGLNFQISTSSNGILLVGTTTNISVPGKVVIASTTTAQLTLQSATGEAPYNFRAVGGSFYLATSSPSSQATSSVSFLSMVATSSTNNFHFRGAVGLGTSTPNWSFQVNDIKPFFVLSDQSAGTDKKHWTMSSQAGSFYVSTSSDIYATSSVAALQIDTNGRIYAPSTLTQAGAATDYWCYDASSQLIRVSAICTTSALKFKKDITPLTQGLDTVLAMKPVEYYLNDLGITDQGNSDQHAQQIGFVADYEATTTPLLIIHDGSGAIHGFNYEQYTAILTKAIQQLNDKVEGKVVIIRKLTRSAEENWQWFAIGLLVLWNLVLTFKKRK